MIPSKGPWVAGAKRTSRGGERETWLRRRFLVLHRRATGDPRVTSSRGMMSIALPKTVAQAAVWRKNVSLASCVLLAPGLLASHPAEN